MEKEGQLLMRDRERKIDTLGIKCGKEVQYILSQNQVHHLSQGICEALESLS